MLPCKLHLDGLDRFKEINCRYDHAGSGTNMKDRWSHISLPIHTMLILTETTIKQGVRASVMLATGLITLDIHRLKFAAVDFLSILVQFVALIALACVAAVDKDEAYKMAYTWRRRMDERENRNWNLTLYQPPSEKCNLIRGIVDPIVERATFPIQLYVEYVFNVVHALLAFKTNEKNNIFTQAKECCAAPFAPLMRWHTKQEIESGHGFESSLSLPTSTE